MARHESDFEAVAEAPFDMGQLLGALGERRQGQRGSHSAALARFLSGEDQGETLKGAFAGPAAGLRNGKES